MVEGSNKEGGDSVGEEKPRELKLVDVSFGASIKFWLAFLVIQIVVMVITFGIMFVFMMMFYRAMSEVISTPMVLVATMLSQLLASL